MKLLIVTMLLRLNPVFALDNFPTLLLAGLCGAVYYVSIQYSPWTIFQRFPIQAKKRDGLNCLNPVFALDNFPTAIFGMVAGLLWVMSQSSIRPGQFSNF